MSRPFFSILLPTKNRSEVLSEAIASVLNQTDADFELIISDNDDSPVATAEVVARYRDARIKYWRTSGKLPMHENWENALSHAVGDYILLLEDKMRMVANMLEVLRGVCQAHPGLPIAYDIKFITGESLPPLAGVRTAEIQDSEQVVNDFCVFKQEFFNLLPKGQNSCTPRPILQTIKEKSPTGLVYSYVTPDYSSGFQILAYVPRFVFLNCCPVYVPHNWMWKGKYSTGQSSYKKENLTHRWLSELPVTIEQIQSFSPVKCQWLWINNVLFDFFNLYRRPGHSPQVNWVKYHAFCWIIVLIGWKLGANMSLEIRAINKSLRQQGILFTVRVAVDVFVRVLKLGGHLALQKLGVG